MTVSGPGFNDRYGAVIHNRLYQSGSSSWDQNIHILIELHKFLRDTAVCGSDQLNRERCDTALLQRSLYGLYDRLV